MKQGFTKAEAKAMFYAVKREAIAYFGEAGIPEWVFSDTKVHVRPETDQQFIKSGSMAYTDMSNSQVYVDENYLPYLYEDELRLMLMHELVHLVASPLDDPVIDHLTAGHGPMFIQEFFNWSGFWGGIMALRDEKNVPWLPKKMVKAIPPEVTVDGNMGEPLTVEDKTNWLHKIL